MEPRHHLWFFLPAISPQSDQDPTISLQEVRETEEEPVKQIQRDATRKTQLCPKKMRGEMGREGGPLMREQKAS